MQEAQAEENNKDMQMVINKNAQFMYTIYRLQHNLSCYSYSQIEHNEIPIVNDSAFIQRLTELPNSEKLDYAIQRSIAAKLQPEMNKCNYCWVPKKYCHCNELKLIEWRNNKKKIKVVFLMTYTEFYRSSNSAKIVLNTLPESEFYIRGLESHEKELETKYFNTDKKMFVLFPSDGAIPIQNTELYCHSTDEEPAVEEQIIMVLDGTWREARRMNKTIPAHIPRVKLLAPNSSTSQKQPLFNGLRKQLFPDSRTSTLESVVIVLRECGLPEQECDKMLNNFKLMINRVRKMSQKELIDFDE